MSDDRAAKLLDEAATAGLRITDLDGWNQTRLAGSLRLRREVVNAIINRDPVAEPSDSRPKMVAACRKIIAFAALISRKDDAVVPRPVEAGERPDDDAQAYECHKLRLRRVVEDAVAGGAFIEGMCRVGELASQAIHAPPPFRVKMIGNLVTAVQRLLDKPESRSIPVDLLDHNLRRLTRAEWAARRAARAIPASAVEERAKTADDLGYIRGQVGYAMIFNGLLANRRRAVRRGRRRLFRAAQAQPSPDFGHWSNLLRAANDLMANRHRPAAKWALSAVRLAETQRDGGFAQAFTRLRENGELTTLIEVWRAEGVMRRVDAVLGRAGGAPARPQSAQPPARRRRASGPTAAAILLLVALLTAPSAARAGDGKELSRRRDSLPRLSGAGSVARVPGPVGGPPLTLPSNAAAPRGFASSRLNALPVPAPSTGVYPARPQQSPARFGFAAAPRPDVPRADARADVRPEPRNTVRAFGEPAEVAAARQRAKKQRLSLPPAFLLAAAERERNATPARADAPASGAGGRSEAEVSEVEGSGPIPPPARIEAEPTTVKSPRRLNATPVAFDDVVRGGVGGDARGS